MVHGDDADQRPAAARTRARDFYSHLGAYAVVIGGFFLLDLVAGGDWWFFWPAIGWSIGLAMHALAVWGPDAWFTEEREARIEP